MTEQEVRAVVEAVVRTLAERGYIKGGASGVNPACGCPTGGSTPQARESMPASAVKVTIGTAGKVFGSEEWKPYKGVIPKDDDGHTHGPECPQQGILII